MRLVVSNTTSDLSWRSNGYLPVSYHQQITGEQFVEPITKALAERMQLMGLMGELEEFASVCFIHRGWHTVYLMYVNVDRT